VSVSLKHGWVENIGMEWIVLALCKPIGPHDNNTHGWLIDMAGTVQASILTESQ